MNNVIERKQGFTIVELLIVIVVIAILAAISITAYNGIQNRTNDSAVQSDLRNFANKVAQYNAINGVYPAGGAANAPGAGTVTFSVSREAYATNRHNFVYCTDGQNFVVTGASKSGNRFAYKSDGGLGPYAQDWGGVISVCTNAGYPNSYSYGYNSNGTWFTWTN